jgi:hypothetical protein
LPATNECKIIWFDNYLITYRVWEGFDPGNHFDSPRKPILLEVIDGELWVPMDGYTAEWFRIYPRDKYSKYEDEWEANGYIHVSYATALGYIRSDLLGLRNCRGPRATEFREITYEQIRDYTGLEFADFGDDPMRWLEWTESEEANRLLGVSFGNLRHTRDTALNHENAAVTF